MWHRGFHPVWAVLLLCGMLSVLAVPAAPPPKPLPEDLKLSPAAVLRSRAMAAYARALYQLRIEAKAGADAPPLAEAVSVFLPVRIGAPPAWPSGLQLRIPAGPLFGPFRAGATDAPPSLTMAERDLLSACLDDPARKDYLELFTGLVEQRRGMREAVRQLWLLWRLRQEAPVVTAALADMLARAGDIPGAIRVDQWGLAACGWTDAGLVRELSARLWEAGRPDESLAVLRTARQKPAMKTVPEVPAWLMERLLQARALPQYGTSWWRRRSLWSEAKSAAAEAVCRHERATAVGTWSPSDLAELSLEIGVTLEMRGAACRLLASARRLAPEDVAWFDLAEADLRFRSGRPREAGALLLQADSRLAEGAPHVQRSSGSGQRHRREGGEELAERFQCNLRLAQLAVTFSDLNTAMSACRRALALQPRNDRLRIFYASILLTSGQPQNAGAVLVRVRASPLMKDKYVLLAMIARSEKKLAAACDLFARVEQLWSAEDPGVPESGPEDAGGGGEGGTTFQPVSFFLDYSLVCEEAGRLELGIRKAKQALAYAPDSAVVQNTLAYLLADHHRELELAELLARKALAQEPQNAAYLDTLAWALHRQGRQKEALDIIRLAVRRASAEELQDGVLWDHAGAIAAAAGRRDEARRWWERALKADPAKSSVIRAKMDGLLQVSGE